MKKRPKRQRVRRPRPRRFYQKQRYSLTELVFSFIMGIVFTLFGLLIIAIHATCVCSEDAQMVNSNRIEHVIYFFMAFCGVWILGLVVSTVRDYL